MTEGCLNCPAGTARLQLQHQHFEVTLGGPHAANTGCQEGGQRERETNRRGWGGGRLHCQQRGYLQRHMDSIWFWSHVSCERTLSGKIEKAPPCCEVKGQWRAKCSFMSKERMWFYSPQSLTAHETVGHKSGPGNQHLSRKKYHR